MVIKKYTFLSLIIVSLISIPPVASAEVFRDQPVVMVSLGDFLEASETYTTPAIFNVGFDVDDEPNKIFAGPLTDGHAFAGTSKATGHQHGKPAEMKVLTCHITTSTTDTMRTNFPWVETGIRVAHVAYFEIENKSDFVRFKIMLHGPEFSTPLVLETLTFGPQEPSHRWGIGFWKTYSVPGLYKIKMTAFPESNKAGGRSSIECSFRVSEPQNN
jgi:hypothetical protein